MIVSSFICICIYVCMYVYVYKYIYIYTVLKPPSLPMNPKVKGIEPQQDEKMSHIYKFTSKCHRLYAFHFTYCQYVNVNVTITKLQYPLKGLCANFQLVCFLSLKGSTCEIMKNIFKENQILEFQIFKLYDAIKYLSIKEIHFTE